MRIRNKSQSCDPKELLPPKPSTWEESKKAVSCASLKMTFNPALTNNSLFSKYPSSQLSFFKDLIS